MQCGTVPMDRGFFIHLGCERAGSISLAHSKKWVAETFSANGRCWAVARVDPYLVSQGKDLLDDTLNELLMVSSSEVGPSY